MYVFTKHEISVIAAFALVLFVVSAPSLTLAAAASKGGDGGKSSPSVNPGSTGSSSGTTTLKPTKGEGGSPSSGTTTSSNSLTPSKGSSGTTTSTTNGGTTKSQNVPTTTTAPSNPTSTSTSTSTAVPATGAVLPPVQGLVDIAVQPNSLVSQASPCCDIVSKAVDPVIQQKINSIANTLATSAIAAQVETGTPCCDAKALTSSSSVVLDQLVIRTGIKGGDTTAVTNTIAQAIKQNPNGVVAKVVANIAKQNSEINTAIDLGATKLAKVGNLQQALQKLDSASSTPCCDAQQLAQSSTTTATPLVNNNAPVSGLVDIAVQPNSLVSSATPCCQIVSKAVDPAIQQKINSIANTLATSAIAAQVANSQPCCDVKALTGAISQVLDQLAIRTGLKGGNPAGPVDAIAAAIQQNPNGLVAKIIANLARQNAQLNYAIDLGAGQVVNGANPQQAFGQLDSASIKPISCVNTENSVGSAASSGSASTKEGASPTPTPTPTPPTTSGSSSGCGSNVERNAHTTPHS